MDDDMLTFRVTLPPIQSAVSIDGQEGGLRIKLDVPPQDRQAALAFVEACRGRVLRLVVVDDAP